jgi:hypothetical protein
MKVSNSKIGSLYGVILALALVSLSLLYVSRDSKDKAESPEVRTETRAFLVGKSLIENHFEQKVFLPDAPPQERGLASTGTLVVTKRNLMGESGRDAWGRPFSYSVQGDGIRDSTLYIWSVGANGTADFKDLKTLIAKGVNGDDILVVIPF